MPMRVSQRDSMIFKTEEFIALTHICIFLKVDIFEKNCVEEMGALRPAEFQ
jgi:hypothetical protein